MSVLDFEAEWCREQLKALNYRLYKCTCWVLHTEACDKLKLQDPQKERGNESYPDRNYSIDTALDG
jgi:hypothetical protein